MRFLLSAGAVLGLFFAQPVAAKSLQDDYAQAWAGREARYKQSIADASAGLKTAFAAVTDAAAAKDVSLGAKLMQVLQQSQDLGFYAARADLVARAEAFLKSKASADAASLWLQDQLDQAKEQSRDADSAMAQVVSMSATVPAFDRFKALGQAAFKRGAALGTLQELQTVQENLGTYYQSKAVLDAQRRERWASVLGAIGQTLRDNEAQNRALLNSTPFPVDTRCVTTGRFTNCTTQ